MNNFGSKIRQLRMKKGWTIKHFIKKLKNKISPTYVTKIEVYGEIPSPEIVCKIATIFGCNKKRLLNLAKQEKIQQYIKRINKLYEQN